MKKFELNPADVEYEVLERFAILMENNPTKNRGHMMNKAKKELRERSLLENGNQ